MEQEGFCGEMENFICTTLVRDTTMRALQWLEQGQDLELVTLILIYCSSLWRILLDSSLWESAGLDIRHLGVSSHWADLRCVSPEVWE